MGLFATSVLKSLERRVNGIDDRAAIAFARNLANNTMLESLDISGSNDITALAWREFANVLCIQQVLSLHLIQITRCNLLVKKICS